MTPFVSLVATPIITGISNDSGVSASDGVTNETQPIVVGTADPNATVIVFVDGVEVDSVLADGSGNWTLTLPYLLDNTYDVTARALDGTGAQSPDSNIFALTVDTLGRDLTVSVLEDGTFSDLNGDGIQDGSTNNTRPTIGGTTEAGAIVQLLTATRDVVASVTADGTGAWSFDIDQLITGGFIDAAFIDGVTGGLFDGIYLVSVVDDAGNETNQIFTIGAAAPEFPSITGVENLAGAVDPNGNTNDATPVLIGRAEAGATVTIFLDADNSGFYDPSTDTELGTVLVDGNGDWRFDLGTVSGFALADRANFFAVQRSGQADIESTAFTVNLDQIAPDGVTNLALSDDRGASDLITNARAQTITGQASFAGERIVLVGPDGAEAVDGQGNIISTLVQINGTWTLTVSGLINGDYTIRIYDSAGNFTDTNGFTISSSIPGGGGNDTIAGWSDGLNDDFDESLSGAAGDDRLVGNGGADTLDGGDDHDLLLGGTGNDLLLGGSGNDTLVGDEGNGSSEDDTLNGGLGDDSLVGGIGLDLLLGDIGNDTLVGGQGDADTLVGGEGNDYYFSDDNNVYIEEAGAAGGIDTVYGSVSSLTLFGAHTLAANIEVLIAGPGGFSFTGAGNDGDNTLIGMARNNTLYGQDGNDSILGGVLDNDLLDGGIGNDTLNGGAGNDTLRGGAGSDTFIVDSYDDFIVDLANDTVSGDIDTVISDVSISINSGVLSLDPVPGQTSGITVGGFANQTGFDVIENLVLSGTAAGAIGNGLNNVITGNGVNNNIYAGGGNDTVFGGQGLDTLVGELGNDYINGQDDTDLLYGNGGNDTLMGEGGDDSAVGGGGNDWLEGGVGQDDLRGNNNNDTLIGGDDSDLLTGGFANDLLVGDAMADTLSAVGGDDELLAGFGNDTVYGGGGSDSITGGAGNDWLHGGAGNDWFFNTAGGQRLSGVDTLIGGAGDDTLNLQPLSWGRQVVSFDGIVFLANGLIIIQGVDQVNNFQGDLIDSSGQVINVGGVPVRGPAQNLADQLDLGGLFDQLGYAATNAARQAALDIRPTATTGLFEIWVDAYATATVDFQLIARVQVTSGTIDLTENIILL